MAVQQRTLIRSLKLPEGANARALAESLVEAFAIASINGSSGEYEVQFLVPSELIVVIGPSRARFFIEPRDKDDDDDLDMDDDEDEEDPHDVAEVVGAHLLRRLGRSGDEDARGDKGSGSTDDDSDEVARRVVARLLEEGLLELVTPRSRTSVEGHLAHLLAQGRLEGTLCDELTEVKGVAELYASDEQLDEILAACRRKKPAAPPKVATEPKPGASFAARVLAAAKLQPPPPDKPKRRPDGDKPRKVKKPS